jgi:predicted outer membrane protein
MRRLSRLVISGAAVALLCAGSAMAQNRVNGPDQTIVVRLHQINQDNVALGQMGAERATNPQVQAFANVMVREQREADDKLLTYASDQDMNLDTIARAPGAGPHGPDAARSAVSAGADTFDYNFVTKAAASYQAAVDVADQGSRLARDPALRALIATQLPSLRAKQAMAEDLARRLPTPRARAVQAPGEPSGVSRTQTGADERPGMGHAVLPSP